MVIEDLKIKGFHLHRNAPYNDGQLITDLRACPARRSAARPKSVSTDKSCRTVKPRTGSWGRYQDHSPKGAFCLLFAAPQKAGRRKGETFETIPFALPLRMHANLKKTHKRPPPTPHQTQHKNKVSLAPEKQNCYPILHELPQRIQGCGLSHKKNEPR